MRENILIVGADSIENGGVLWRTLSDTLHYQIIGVSNTEKAIEWLQSGRTPFPDLILLNEIADGVALLSAVQLCKRLRPELPILVFTAYGNEPHGMDAVKSGAFDFIVKPVSVERLQVAVQNALKSRRMSQYILWLERKAAGHTALEDMVGQSASFKEVINKAAQYSATDEPIWLDGETGAGKTLMSRAIHGQSPRAAKPMIVVNCELLPQGMAAEVLFGSESVMPETETHYMLGKLREADQGTLLLQNPGVLPHDLWEPLMLTLKTGELKPQGAAVATKVDVRLICADSRALKFKKNNGDFHELLSKHFETREIILPSLADRPGDIRLLGQHFLLVHATSENKYITSITDRGLAWLEQTPWPGNVGELANAIWRAVMICENPVLDVTELRTVQRNRSMYLYSQTSDSVLIDNNGRVKPLKSVQQEAIRFALEQENGCMTRAARSLGIGRSTLYRKVQEYSLGAMVNKTANS